MEARENGSLAALTPQSGPYAAEGRSGQTGSSGNRPLSPLTEDIFRKSERMNFYKFCRVLEEAEAGFAGFGLKDSPAGEPVRFRPWPKLGFPTCEIMAIETDEEQPQAKPSARTTFLGLYGVDAIIPYYFIEDIAMGQEGCEPLAAFLDIFNHRFISLYYRAWKKYRYPVGYLPDGGDQVSRCLLSLCGLGLGDIIEKREVPVIDMLTLLGFFIQRTRPAEGLEAVLSRLVLGAKVRVREFYPVRRSLEEPLALTKGQRLQTGEMVLGRHFFDCGNRVEAVITPSSDDQLASLLPDQPALLKILKTVISAYVGYRVEVDLALEVESHKLPETRLGKAGLHLGFTRPIGPPSDRKVKIKLWRHAA